MVERQTFYVYNITNENPYNVYKIYTNKITQNTETIHNANITDNTIQQEINTNSTNCHVEHGEASQATDSHKDNSTSTQNNKYPHLNTTLQSQKIDYIIFLDSDDCWKSYCIEECIKYSNGVDIVWFDWEYYYEGVKNNMGKSSLQLLAFKQGEITPKELFESLVEKDLPCFAWAVSGIIDFKFLQKINLYFYDGVFAEDHLFGALLFLQSKTFYVIPQPLYIYRIRANSLCDFDQQHVFIPYYFEKYCDIFGSRQMTKDYYIANSWFLMLIDLIQFIKNHPSEHNEHVEKFCFSYYIPDSIVLLRFKHDPLNLIPKLIILEPYLDKKFKWRDRLRITNPAIYRRLKPLFSIYSSIKTC